MRKVNLVQRLLAHLLSGPWSVRRRFPAESLDQIEREVSQGETRHSAEIRIAIEHSLGLWAIALHNRQPRHRAIEVFSELHVWDTADNNGILIYLLLADRSVEILADRTAAQRVDQRAWDTARDMILDACRRQQHAQGVIAAVELLNDELARHFPPGARNPNELPDRPAIL